MPNNDKNLCHLAMKLTNQTMDLQVGARVSIDDQTNTAQSRNNALDPVYDITSTIAYHAIEPINENVNNATVIWQKKRHGRAAQNWSIHHADPGYYYIRCKGSWKFLTVNGGSTKAKAYVVQQELSYNLKEAQQWKLIWHKATGSYYVQNRKSGMMLDVMYGSDKDQAIIWQYPYNGTKAQRFKFLINDSEVEGWTKTYGGAGGQGFRLLPYNDGDLIGMKKVSQLYFQHDKYISSVQVNWMMRNGRSVWSKKAGGNGSKGTRVILHTDEYITTVSGIHDRFITQLTLRTNKGRTFVIGEGSRGVRFNMNIPSGLKGFYGKAGWYLDSIGALH